jgi:hypothetical protein
MHAITYGQSVKADELSTTERLIICQYAEKLLGNDYRAELTVGNYYLTIERTHR